MFRKWFVATAVVSIALFFALWPFHFRMPAYSVDNGARMSKNSEILIEAPGIVVDPDAHELLYRGLHDRDAITVAVAAESFAAEQDGPARIVSFARDPQQANMTLGQVGDGIVFRLRTPVTGEVGIVTGLHAARGVKPGYVQLFVATYDGRHFRIYVDGRLVSDQELAAGQLAGWNPNFQLSFGNEASGNRPWLGRILDVAILNEALDADRVAALDFETFSAPLASQVYRLRERCPGIDASLSSCEVPALLHITDRFEMLSFKGRRFSDYIENAIVWGVLGLVFGFSFKERRLLDMVVPLVICAAASETTQALIPSRSSSLLDLVTAILAGSLAVTVGRHASAMRQAHQT
jgi:hypothetical protein